MNYTTPPSLVIGISKVVAVFVGHFFWRTISGLVRTSKSTLVQYRLDSWWITPEMKGWFSVGMLSTHVSSRTHDHNQPPHNMTNNDDDGNFQ